MKHTRALALSAGLWLGAASAYAAEPALPTGGQIVAGSGQIDRSGNQVTVTQSSERLIAQWDTFNIGTEGSVRFDQPGASSVALNRILDANPSQILGRLSANGQVFLLNPNGIFFGTSAQVNVGGIVASSLALSNDDFLAGRYVFSHAGSAGRVENQGNITAAGGVVALIAPQVSNSGTIDTPGGGAILAAGNTVSLDFQGDGLVTANVDQATFNALVENKGLIKADGGFVVMTARSANALLDTVVNNDGIVRARSLQNKNGRILLDGGDTGVTRISGTLDVSGDHGGTVVVTGNNVGLFDSARLDASGANGGGDIYLGGGRQGGDAAIHNARAVYVSADSAITADATGNGNGGTAIVYSRDSTQVYGRSSVRGGADGGNGGFIETSGGWLNISRTPDISAPAGKGGTWLIDPYDISVDAAGGNTNINTSSPFASSGDSASLGIDLIDTALASGDVTIQTSAGGSQAGNITWNVDYTYTGASARTLTLQAHNNIALAASSGIHSSNGALGVTLTSDSDASSSGGITMNSGSSIVSNGGNIALTGNSINLSGTAVNSGSGTLTFTAANTISGTSNISASNNNLILNAGSGSGTLSGVIALGSGTLTKQGAGTVVLSGANTYTGVTTVSAGTLGVANATGLGTTTAGTSVASGATLDLQNVAVGNEGVTISGGTLRTSTGTSSLAGNVTFNTASSTIDVSGMQLTLSSTVSGSVQISKTGSGTAVFSGTNSYSGALLINAGTFVAASATALGNTFGSTTVASGATLDVQAAVGSEGLTVNGGTIRNSTGTSSFGGGITLGADSTIDVSGTQLSLTGVITGAGGFTKTGNGIAVLTRANTYTGAVAVNAGTLAISNASALGTAASGTTVASGTTLDIRSVNVSSEAITLNGGTLQTSTGTSNFGGSLTLAANSTIDVGGVSLTLSGGISGSGFGLTKTGSGIGVLAGANTYTGATTVSAGTLRVTNDTGLGTTAGGTTVASGTILELQSVTIGAEAIALNGGTLKTASGTSSLSGNVTLGADSTIDVGGIQLTLSGAIGGSFGINKTSGNLLVLSGTNTYTGATTVSAGTLRYGVNNALSNSTAVTVASGATFDLNDNSDTIGSLAGSGDVSLGAGTLTTGADNSSTVFSGVLFGGGGLIKSGSGTFTLSGLNSYTGATAVNVGTLLLGASNSLASGTIVTVASGAILDLNGFNYTIGSLAGAGNVSLGAGSLTTGGADSDTTFSGVLTGSGGLTKAGSGIFTLAGGNTYGGATAVTAGTLQITNATGLGSTAGGTVVANGATLQINNAAVGAEAVTVNGTGVSGLGALQGSGTSSLAGTLTVNTDALISGSGTLTLGAINLVNSRTATLGSGGALNFTTGAITGVGGGTSNLTVNTTGSANLGTIGTGIGAVNITASDTTLNAITADTITISDNGSNGVTLNGVLSAGALNNANALLIVTNKFTNNYGAGALSASNGTSRWLVYSADPSADTRNGLSYDFKRYNCSYSGGCLTSGTSVPTSGNGLLYSAAPVLSVAPASQTITYGNAASAFTPTFSGFIDGDTGSTSGIYGTAGFTVGESTSTAGYYSAGLHEVTYTSGLSSALGYTFQNNASFSNELTVNQASLSVSGITANNKVYDTTTSATLAGTAAVMALGSDDVSVTGIGSGSFIDKGVGTGKTVAISGFSLSGADAGNYQIAQPSGLTASISPVTLSVTGFTVEDKTYDGNTTATIANFGSLSGVLGADTVGLNTSAAQANFANSEIGLEKNVTITGLALSGADAGNYLLSNPTATADINSNTVNNSNSNSNASINAIATGLLSSALGANGTTYAATGSSGNDVAADAPLSTIQPGAGTQLLKEVATETLVIDQTCSGDPARECK